MSAVLLALWTMHSLASTEPPPFATSFVNTLQG